VAAQGKVENPSHSRPFEALSDDKAGERIFDFLEGTKTRREQEMIPIDIIIGQ
jgi:hypothetical protein